MTSLKGYNVFKDNITYVSYARSGVEYYTTDLNEVYEFNKEGWKFNSYYNGFRLIPPEECIVDITDYQKASQYKNLEFNLVYYDFLNELLLKNKLNNFINKIIEQKDIFYKNFLYLVSYGPILEIEIRIAGSDKRIKNLKMDMVEAFLNSKEYECLIKNKMNIKKYLNEKNIELKDRGIIEQKFFYDVDQKVNMIKNVNTYNEKIYKISNIEILNIEQFDVILFIPYGCFKYLSSFVKSDIVDKIMFWEIHIEQTKGTSFKLFNKNLKNKNVLIIDNMYSGKTIDKIKKLVQQEGGKPTILGLNPKNKNNIINSDYIMILNKILKSDSLNLKQEDFFKSMYLEVLKNKN